MATVLLSAAGAAIGSSIGGTALGIGAATIGQAVGAIAGGLIDQKILGSGSAAVETGRARSLRLQGSTEGAAIPRVWGRMRVAGQVIWATRYQEHVRTTRQGGKASRPARTTTEYSYTISAAVALCQGPIARIGRVWADGKLLDLAGINHRVYLGDEIQLPDPKIEAVEGAGRAPAYRGIAYVVFEDLPVGTFGNRIPQLNFEVFRNADAELTGPEAGAPLPDLVRGVCLSPGTGEFALDPKPARVAYPGGGGRYANINNATGLPDFAAAIDQLEAELPACDTVSLVVAWFGDDLRAGHCRVEPRIEEVGRVYSPEFWGVAGLTTGTATPVTRDGTGRPNYGGTPSDGSVIRAIQDLTARGKKVVLYPFLLMDIPSGNGLPDPYGGAEQAAFPWRGRITLDAAPGQPGSADQTAAAAADVAAFFGTAEASDFAVGAGTVGYSGPDEWTWRRFVLHLAALGAAAGGVEAICVATEMRGLTTIRSAKTVFPAVAELIQLAAEARTLLPSAKITYAADWSEYFGYQPADGSGDALFHLDPLWADANIDMIGIDDYTPLSDWRYTSGHLDASAGSIYSLSYLTSGVEGGEYYDWYYASEADRAAQTRSPIGDGAYGEPWIFRPKDVRNWWLNAHHDRIDGVRQTTPTAWVPQSKPVWLTETGCPAVDLGANKPNTFVDPKSSESALPPGSRGARDDEMQRRFLQAKLGYWADAANNPTSAVYGAPMIPDAGVFVWTWDARPWPDFPVRGSLWADGPAHRLGHWLTGRVTAGSLAEVVTEICLASGLALGDFDVSRLFGMVDGYLVERTASGREALQPLMQAYGFDAFESAGRIVFAMRADGGVTALATDAMVPGDGPDHAPVVREKARATSVVDTVRLSYVQAETDYRVAAAEARLPGGPQLRVAESSVALALPGSRAQGIVERWLAEALRAQDGAAFTLAPSALALEPGDVVELAGAGQAERYRIDRIVDSGPREIEAVRVEPGLYLPIAAPERLVEPDAAAPPGPVEVVVMDLPLADGSAADHQPRIAVAAEPWPGEVAVWKSPDGQGFTQAATLTRPALIGRSATALAWGAPGRWQRVQWDVRLPGGGIDSVERLAVLNGANRLVVELPGGSWELLQARDAVLVDVDTYRLGFLLRGQRGTDVLSTATIPAGARVVVLDGAEVPLPVAAEERGLTRHWRIGPAQFDISHPAMVAIEAAYHGVGLRPFAPAHLRARPAGGDIALNWVRATRIGGDGLQVVEVPLGEEREAYRVTVRAGATVLRTAETMAPAFTYTAAMQAVDGATGTLAIGVAQLSAAFGYGPERVISVDV